MCNVIAMYCVVRTVCPYYTGGNAVLYTLVYNVISNSTFWQICEWCTIVTSGDFCWGRGQPCEALHDVIARKKTGECR